MTPHPPLQTPGGRVTQDPFHPVRPPSAAHSWAYSRGPGSPPSRLSSRPPPRNDPAPPDRHPLVRPPEGRERRRRPAVRRPHGHERHPALARPASPASCDRGAADRQAARTRAAGMAAWQAERAWLHVLVAVSAASGGCGRRTQMPAGGRRTNHVAAEVPQIAKLPAEVLQIAGWSGGAADRQASLLAFAPRVRSSRSPVVFAPRVPARHPRVPVPVPVPVPAPLVPAPAPALRSRYSPC